MIGVPYWLLVLLFAIAPAWWVLRWRHRWIARRIKQGLCPVCGYDLRASPQRCPECGRHVPVPQPP
jgi:predicted amidophosphoribosyltransferase